MILLAVLARLLARLATWSNRVLTDAATDITRAQQRAQASKDYR